ncbi:MAG: cobalamin-binding protein [Nitrospiraceae bacterium]
MRICSLLPGATEIVAALGLSDRLVGISHECDYPPGVQSVPVMVDPLVDSTHLSSAEIDAQVRTALDRQSSLYRLREPSLAGAHPELIIVQDLCHVCAVTPAQLHRVIDSLSPRPRVLTLNPQSLEDVLVDIERIGSAVERRDTAQRLTVDLRRRLAAIEHQVNPAQRRPRVACLEWLSPLYCAGHWVPDMVRIAGGIDTLGTSGKPSRVVTWEELAEAAPDVLVIMPCGFTKERATQEWELLAPSAEWQSIPAVQTGRVSIVNALAYFSRPGPRLVDGVAQLASLFHPDLASDIALSPPAHGKERANRS